jgi:membrane protein YqaA with SNARE-associated domain
VLAYLSLFVLSLLSATLLPGGSEALLLYDLSLGYSPLLLFFAATIGNTLGSLINYFLGLKGVAYLLRKNFSNSQQLERAQYYFQKYGAWALLLSWVPIIGDPITLIAGVFKYHLKRFIIIVLLSKAIRYIAVILLFDY